MFVVVKDRSVPRVNIADRVFKDGGRQCKFYVSCFLLSKP